jgi:carboxymethylenebutenolidase
MTQISRISIHAPDGPLPADLVVPAGAGPWPGVVVVHDGFGLSDDIRRNAERFAENGFLALAPDLFARGGLRCVAATMRAQLRGHGPAVADLNAAREVLADRADCSGKVGIAGFCLGGGFALVMGSKGFDVAAPFYPSIVTSFEKLADGSCPVVASFGSRDPLNPRGAPRLKRALDKEGVTYDIKTYDGVGHSFANDLAGQPILRIAGFGYDADVTADAYRRVFAFFGEHLRTS